MTDYHSKPILAVRVSADVQDWARAEAKRREQGIGDFVEGALTAERERTTVPCDHRVPVGAYCRTCDKIKEG